MGEERGGEVRWGRTGEVGWSEEMGGEVGRGRKDEGRWDEGRGGRRRWGQVGDGGGGGVRSGGGGRPITIAGTVFAGYGKSVSSRWGS